MSEISEYASWAGVFMGLVAIVPKMLAVISRKRALDVQGEISRFETVLKAQDAQLDGCKEECQQLEKELAEERAERIREREYFFRQIAESARRVNDCEGLMRRHGIPDDRKTRRNAG